MESSMEYFCYQKYEENSKKDMELLELLDMKLFHNYLQTIIRILLLMS